MNGSNKILTVSYGTFSCTLEGFEDPFNSMRSIAEYFRDLAADDRYFGAEPPTPDVEMLQALAERGTRGQVSARLSDTGVALSVAPSPAADGADTAPLTLDDDFTSDEPEDALVVDAKSEEVDERAETIADKLSRIRAVVSRQQTPVPAEEFIDDDNAPEPPRSRALTRTLSDIAADIAGDDDDEGEADVVEMSDDAPEDSDDWSVISEPVDEEDAASEDEGEGLWDEPILKEATEAVVEEPAAEVHSAEAEDENVAETVDAISDDVKERSEAEDDFAAVAASLIAEMEEATQESSAEDDLSGARVAESDPDEADDRDDIRAKAALFASDGEAVEDEAGISEVSSDAIEAVSEEDHTPQQIESGSDEALSRAQPDDFESVTDDVANQDESEEDDSPIDEDSEPLRESASGHRRESRLLEPVDDDEAGVGRLMHEAEGKLADDDSIRRRRVISQMRAAVAATRADRILSRVSPQRQAETADHPYRRDLDRVVSEPRKSTPLVLVSAQRVEDRQPETVIPPSRAADEVRSGLAETSSSQKASDKEAFARFVKEMDAEGLPDLLEAAAAFAAFVEGEPHFSRPDLMRRVAEQASDMHVSREQGLRSFGQLLREGKIRKLQRGQFTIDEGTRFNPAHRIAGE